MISEVSFAAPGFVGSVDDAFVREVISESIDKKDDGYRQENPSGPVGPMAEEELDERHACHGYRKRRGEERQQGALIR